MNILQNTKNPREKRKLRELIRTQSQQLTFTKLCSTADPNEMFNFLNNQVDNTVHEGFLPKRRRKRKSSIFNPSSTPKNNNDSNKKFYELISQCKQIEFSKLVVKLSKIEVRQNQLPYLGKSFKELEKSLQSYKKWCKGFYLRCLDDDEIHDFRDGCSVIGVPNIDLKIPKDELEGLDDDQQDEW
jgi:NAD-dependent DNA ligase